MTDWKPRYSGPDCSGICKCGHSWEDHHLGFVMNEEYYNATKESCVPEECCFYGCNEEGGMMPGVFPEDDWVYHCNNYEDNKE